MRRFQLHREVDVTGVSGTGLVAEGVVFTNGKCALTWLTGISSVTVHDSFENVDKIHGHHGSTTIVFIDEEES